MALAAENLPPFEGVKLLHIKSSVMHLLTLIGREKIFSEYTKHDISHIDAMLDMVEWVIPADTQASMTSADWLLLVLSIYLHDMGMVVTEEEYKNRSVDRVERFAEDQLFSGEDGDDYQARLDGLDPADRERFIFEEFIRDTHGQRVKTWVDSSPAQSSSVMHKEIAKLVEPLPKTFRKDLALVCESHHLDDLGDHSKYPLDKPYGNGLGETANIQYAALILRTTDLLHITADRTPPILFRTINPTSPVSQREWVKQKAVRNVRAQHKRDKDGNLDLESQPHTIEVFADFEEPEGFFALTSYLVYAQRQLQRSNEWANAAAPKTPRPYVFPWRSIDEANIEVSGYLPQPYEFTVDQQRVLKLLTGHTLYNQTDVVVRELVQNSLDAIRLQSLTEARESDGSVEVAFNSQDRVLTVTDNGTGMTQRIIEQHLLRVGSSRYQDPEFRKRYPNFSAISRFGIGVLSAFMVADRVEILTRHQDEEAAKQLTLRTVTGRYLMRELEADAGSSIGPHGTRVTLWLRPSATLGNVAEIMDHWIVIPRCKVTVAIDGDEPREVGYETAAAALEAYLVAEGFTIETGALEVKERERDGVHLAWATRWSDYFRNWSVVRLADQGPESQRAKRLGLCVEGVRVEDGTPGYHTVTYAAIGNAVGPDAPKTNVARSGLEQTPQRLAALSAVYTTMCDEVTAESEAMVNERDVSLTWATEEARWSLVPIRMGAPRSRERLETALKTVPTLLVEADGLRKRISPAEVEEMDACWTVESNTFASAERMLRELAANVSISSLRKAFGSNDLEMPDGPVITGYSRGGSVVGLAFGGKEVAEFIVKPDQRRVDLRWTRKGDDGGLWRVPRELVSRQRRELFRGFGPQQVRVLVGRNGVKSNSTDTTAIKAFGQLFVLPNTPISDFVNGKIDELGSLEPTPESDAALLFTELLLRDLPNNLTGKGDQVDRFIEQLSSLVISELGRLPVVKVVEDHLDMGEFAAALRASNWSVFDPSQWLRENDNSAQ
jgi:hypothetical protein